MASSIAMPSGCAVPFSGASQIAAVDAADSWTVNVRRWLSLSQA